MNLIKMVLLHNTCCGTCLILFRKLHLYSVLRTNHYRVLGLKPTATQSEIKAAYYELSKKHHPDKNQGSEASVKLFRNITEAYEILGNEKLRKKYDESHRFNLGVDSRGFRSPEAGDYNDDVERMYYERKRNQFRKGKSYGKTTHYNFDAWYKAHYGENNYSNPDSFFGKNRSSNFDNFDTSQFQRVKTFGMRSRTYKEAADEKKKLESFVHKSELILMLAFYGMVFVMLFLR